MIAGVVLAHAARREFSGRVDRVGDVLHPYRRTVLYATISCRYSSADFSWSLASIVDARVGPSKLPLAWLVFALPMASAHVVQRQPVGAQAPWD